MCTRGMMPPEGPRCAAALNGSMALKAASAYACSCIPLGEAPARFDLSAALGRNRTAWFVGDSTTFGTYFEAVCRVENRTSAAASWRRLSFPNSCRQSYTQAHRFPMCAHISLSNGFSQQLCYVPEHEQPERALTRLMDVGLVTPNDVVLINTGANQMGGDEPMLLRGVQGLVDLLHRRAGKTPHVYWRETYAQHFPEYALKTTSVGLRRFDGSFNLRASKQGAYRNTSCVTQSPPPEKPRVLQRVEEIIRETAFNTSRMHWISAWEMTLERASSHKCTASEHVQSCSLAVDCTHYCLHSGVDDLVLNDLTAALQRHTQTSSSTRMANARNSR